MPPVYDHLCLCVKCTATQPDGVLVSAQTYRVHRLKRPPNPNLLTCAPDRANDAQPTSQLEPSQPPAIQPEPSQPPASSSHAQPSISIVKARLELQDIRYHFLARPFSRPQRLEFVGRPKTAIPIQANRYIYRGIFNAVPYDLLESPMNALFLRQEAQMHQWASRISQLRELYTDSNYQLSCKSIETAIIDALNQMFYWKVEIYCEQHASPATPNSETTSTSAPTVESVVHLVYNTPQHVCELVLAYTHDQIEGLEDLVSDKRRQRLGKLLPQTVKGTLAAFELDPVVRKYLVCPRCYGIVPRLDNPPETCPHRETQCSQPCNAKLTRTNHATTGAVTSRPIKEYIHQDFREWLGRFLCRPDIENTLHRRKTEFGEWKERVREDTDPLVHDILQSKGILEFKWPDGKPFYDCPDDELRLFFALSGDGFNPFLNRKAKQTVTSTGLYLFCLNLPLEERQKPENIYLAGVIPGPDKPSTTQINNYISLIVNDFLPFWNTGVRYSHTWKHHAGILSRAAIVPVLADALGVRQLCGYGAATSNFFCTFCWLKISDIENFNKASWPGRDLTKHRFWAEQWRDADEGTRQKLFQEHGIRWTPLFLLPYFDPIKFCVVDTMHNLFTGLLQRHCRNIWGMDLEVEDGDGELPPRRTVPPEPSVHAMQRVRKALEFKDVQALNATRKEPLFHLCLELDLCRGRKKKDWIRELLQWRKKQGAFITDPRWQDTERDEEVEVVEAPLSRTYFPSPNQGHHPGPSTAPNPTVSTPPGQQHTTPLPFHPAHPATANAPQLPSFPVVLPAEVSAEKIDAGEDAFARGLKLSSLTNDVLVTLCVRRGINLPPWYLKKDLVAVLEQWRQVNGGLTKPSKPKRSTKPKTVVLGHTVLTAAAEDMEKMILPHWVKPAPIRAGQKSHGKLSADQWQSFCSIHLVVTLIRIWGRQPKESRWFDMLTNFLDLVRAVEISTLLVTSKEHISAYETFMTQYLVTMKNLYKEARVAPNHHYALHTPDFLGLWGPSPQVRGFGWERFNYILQQVNTNKRFGDIEKSYMFTISRRANLLSLLALDYIRSKISQMYSRLKKFLHPEGCGTREDFLDQPSEFAPHPIVESKRSQRRDTLSEQLIEALAIVLNSEPGRAFAYVPLHISSIVGAGQCPVAPSVTTLHCLKHRGIAYRPSHHSLRNSNILVRVEFEEAYRPARLDQIFRHRREIHQHKELEELFCVIRYLKPLPPQLLEHDWFREFGSTGGSLWTTEYEESPYTGFDRPTFHILPLNKLKIQIESAGDVVMDDSFDEMVEGVKEEEEDNNDNDMDMDID